MKIDVSLRDFLESFIDNYSKISIFIGRDEIAHNQDKEQILHICRNFLDRKVLNVNLHWWTETYSELFNDNEEACIGIEISE